MPWEVWELGNNVTWSTFLKGPLTAIGLEGWKGARGREMHEELPAVVEWQVIVAWTERQGWDGEKRWIQNLFSSQQDSLVNCMWKVIRKRELRMISRFGVWTTWERWSLTKRGKTKIRLEREHIVGAGRILNLTCLLDIWLDVAVKHRAWSPGRGPDGTSTSRSRQSYLMPGEYEITQEDSGMERRGSWTGLQDTPVFRSQEKKKLAEDEASEVEGTLGELRVPKASWPCNSIHSRRSSAKSPRSRRAAQAFICVPGQRHSKTRFWSTKWLSGSHTIWPWC